jgi:hypothetical protein
MADKLQGVWVGGKFLTSRKALLARARTLAVIARNAFNGVPDRDPRKPGLERELSRLEFIVEHCRRAMT